MNQKLFIAALDTIRAVAATPSKNDKIKLLRQGDSEYLRKLLLWCYNKYVTYRILQIDYPYVYNSITPDIMYELEDLLKTLSSHTVGTLESKRLVKNLLSRCTREDAQIIANVITRDLRAGLDIKTINSAFPALVPVFGLQLAKALDTWDRVSFPIIVDEKIDGIRCVPLYDGERTRFYSRNGFEFNGMQAFAAEIEQLLPGVPNAFDAEFVAAKFNPDDPVCRKHKDGNWAFEYAKSISRRKDINPDEIREFFQLCIWDVIDLEYFQSQGVRGRKETTEERKGNLFAMFARHNREFMNIVMLPSYVMHCRAEVQRYMLDLKLRRKEGCMLKPMQAYYTFAKNYNVIKLKHFVEGDFRIVGAYEGEKGKKYEGMLGGVVIATDDGKLKCNMGTGFSDDQRLELWVEYLAGRLTNKIAEIQFKDITADGCLQLPTLNRFREDKDSTDTYEEILAKLQGMREEDE